MPETGTLAGEYPYVRAGSASSSRALAIFPGIGDALFSGRYPPGSGWTFGAYVARYTEHAVYLVSRPRGLPAGYDPAAAAEGHARALEEITDREGTGAVDVIGISMGGLIGQALARRYPETIDRLVLANSACRLDEGARDDVREFERDARERDWFSIRADLARAMFSDARSITYPPVIRTVGRATLPRPAVPADVRRSLEFVLAFDSREYLEGIEVPTLVFGGERDPYFTPAVVRETVDGLPNASVRLVPRAKHGAFHERKPTFDSCVSSFFERE